MAKTRATPSHRDVQSIRQMAIALDMAWEQLPDSSRTDVTRQRLAGFIVDRFRGGEHDPARLGELARSDILAANPAGGAA